MLQPTLCCMRHAEHFATVQGGRVPLCLRGSTTRSVMKRPTISSVRRGCVLSPPITNLRSRRGSECRQPQRWNGCIYRASRAAPTRCPVTSGRRPATAARSGRDHYLLARRNAPGWAVVIRTDRTAELRQRGRRRNSGIRDASTGCGDWASATRTHHTGVGAVRRTRLALGAGHCGPCPGIALFPRRPSAFPGSVVLRNFSEPGGRNPSSEAVYPGRLRELSLCRVRCSE